MSDANSDRSTPFRLQATWNAPRLEILSTRRTAAGGEGEYECGAGGPFTQCDGTPTTPEPS